MEQMTPKERWLAAIQMKPVDRLPFWPKLDGAYPKAQEAPFRDLEVDAIHDWIGSDKHTWIADCTREVRKRTAVNTSQENGTMRTVYRSPSGELQLVRKFDAPSHSWHPTEFPTSLLDGRSACPDKCLIGGTNAMLWTTTAHGIISKIEEDLNELPHHRGIAVTSAGVMPPMCKPEIIKRVCEWVKQYPARLN